MKVSFWSACFLVISVSFLPHAECYDISLSKYYMKVQLLEWSNFTVHIESKGNVYQVNNLVIEVNNTDGTTVSPKIIEINTKNFSSWGHMFHVYAVKPGPSNIFLMFTNGSGSENNLTVDVDVIRMKTLEVYSGWCRKYFYIFSVLSVYPQLFMQFFRLSVVGLDMDYVCFNFIGHFSYFIYTVFMQTQTDSYSQRNPDGDFPVSVLENGYSLHGLIISVILGLQCIKYYGVDKRITMAGKEIISFYGIVFVFGFLLAKFHIIQYLDFLYICQYMHVAAAGTKYIPQLYRNFVIKSTFGWNIWNSNFEAAGCVCLIIYFLLTAYNCEKFADPRLVDDDHYAFVLGGLCADFGTRRLHGTALLFVSKSGQNLTSMNFRKSPCKKRFPCTSRIQV
ncbi:hypothetical protein NQ318_012842 [Aromia moschata]|uniref:Uncharacterized protein n=1 Tax=Aromia moschata TaxID=1265417 RepID=A0AAV8XNX9_9CUCU|nr:hypothetical protein NQ318_012842 [Aromia moschata]